MMFFGEFFLKLSTFSLLLVFPPNGNAFGREELSADCGRAASRVLTGNPGELVDSTLGSSPWHTVLYKVSPDDPNNWEFACSGNIIAEDIVITAANCVFVEFVRVFYNASRFRVVAAKIHLSLNQDVENSQPREVKKIVPHGVYTGDISVHSDNLALLLVDPPFSFNQYIAPICIDWEGKTSRLSLSSTSIAGWGLRRGSVRSDVLQEGSFPIVQNRECRTAYRRTQQLRFISYDKFCIITPNGRTVEDSGSGSVVKFDGRYYLEGVMSAFLIGNLTVATNITKHREWLKTTMTRIWEEKNCKFGFLCGDNVCIASTKKCDLIPDCADKSDESRETCKNLGFVDGNERKKCILPLQPGDVVYRVQNCKTDPCTRLPLTLMDSGQKMEMKCGRTTKPSAVGSQFVCINSEWFPGRPECVKMCPPRTSHGVLVQCEHNRWKVNCSDFMSPGTVVTGRCKRLYKFRDPLLSDKHSKCMEGGVWSNDLPVCEPECGISNVVDSTTPTITSARNVTYGKYPWHVGLYFSNRTSNKWEQFCGGTLITTSMVLTAAHCLEVVTVQDLLVVGGRIYRELESSELYQQMSLVKDLMKPTRYEGFTTKYEYDIALVELATPFEIMEFLLPCCLDFRTHLADFLRRITIVSVVGWGFSEKSLKADGGANSNPVLKETQLQVVQTEDCRKRDKDFLPYFTNDKFCATYPSGSGPRRGDSGGGLVVFNGDAHHLVGVVSVNPTSHNDFSAFTNVGHHRDWIKAHLRDPKKW